MSRYRNEDEQRGYDSRREDGRGGYHHGEGYDFEQGWIERDREERRARERADEERQMEECEQERQRQQCQPEPEQEPPPEDLTQSQ